MGKDKKKFSFSVSRDNEGNVKPVEGATPLTGMEIKIRPITYGEAKQYKYFGERELQNWPFEELAKLLRNHVVEVDEQSMEDVTEEDVAGIEGFALLDILHAITLYSGFGRVFEHMEARADSGKEEIRPTLHQATGDSKDNSTDSDTDTPDPETSTN